MHRSDIGSWRIRSQSHDLMGIQREIATRIGSAPIVLVIMGGGLLFFTAIALQSWVLVVDLLRDPLAVAEMSASCLQGLFRLRVQCRFDAAVQAGACLFAAAPLFALGQRDHFERAAACFPF